MNKLNEQELLNVDGGGWIADMVRSALCWYESHSAEIAEGYKNMYESGLMGPS
jgi:hypothetical protein